MAALKIIVSIVVLVAGLRATLRPVGAHRFPARFYDRVGILLTTVFLLLMLWS